MNCYRIQRRYKRKNQDFTGHKQDIKALQAENTRFKEDLQNTPDPLELFQLRARSEELERHNTKLKQDLEALNNIHSNYIAGSNTHQSEGYRGPGAKKPWRRFW